MKYIFLFLIFLCAVTIGISGWTPNKHELLTPSLSSGVIMNTKFQEHKYLNTANLNTARNEFMLEVITIPFVKVFK